MKKQTKGSAEKPPKTVWSWKNTAVAPGKYARPFGEALEQLAAEGVDRTASNVLDRAKDPASPIHRMFEWDDRRAGNSYRIGQARRFIGSIEKLVITSTGATHRKAFYAITRAPTPSDASQARRIHIRETREEVQDVGEKRLQVSRQHCGIIESLCGNAEDIGAVADFPAWNEITAAVRRLRAQLDKAAVAMELQEASA